MKGLEHTIPKFDYEATQYCLNCSFPYDSKRQDIKEDRYRKLKELKDCGNYKQLYDSLTVTCHLTNCGKKYQLRDREHHLKNECRYFRYYNCTAKICKIKDSAKTCGCFACEKHDCYGLKSDEATVQVS